MRIVLVVAALVSLLLAVMVFRAVGLQPAPKAPPAAELVAVDAAAAAERLAGAVRIPTVTHNDPGKVDWAQLPRLHAYLARQFPRVHRQLEREVVNRYALLYRWAGTDATAAPVLMLAHQDVVPVEPGTEDDWQHPPFAGAVADGFVWGRGTLDDKSSLVAQLEAVELLLADGFRPRRTLYFAFGHDEEIGGRDGALAIAALLARRGIQAEFSLDEGGAITEGVIAGVEVPVASVMTAEKGYVSLELVARAPGGHSSQPPRATAIGRLARAVARLEQHLPATRLAPPVTDMLERVAFAMPVPARLAVANRWLFGPLIERQLAAAPVTDALIRTTTAPTVFAAGIKDNVLPVEARATVNFRILPGDSSAGVADHVRRVIDDPTIEIRPVGFASEPSAAASSGTAGFALLERTINEVYPEAIVTPGLVIGATDNRHYREVRRAGYNFAPLRLTPEDVRRLHGANERVAVADHARAIQFYARLFRNVAGP